MLETEIQAAVALTVAEFGPAVIDAITAAAELARSFLRRAWYAAGGDLRATPGALRPDGTPLLAIPLASRKLGPLRIGEVAGPYWPWRSVPIAADARNEEVAAFLADPGARRLLGRVWRLGPVHADDPAAAKLMRAAPAAGWTVLRRSLATCFELDVAALRAGGEWPKASTRRKNRWRERRLAEDGEIAYSFLSGAEWTPAHLDAIAEVEAHCWLAALDGGGDTKFLDPARRAQWERIAADPALAPMLFSSLMTIGGTPAAFTFGIEAGGTRHYIANNYNERFAKFGPGKILLYLDFERAADAGVTKIGWGAGDAGYKTEMGATPGPEILDLLFVRGRTLAAALKPLFLRKA